jgi:hypothetical protein
MGGLRTGEAVVDSMSVMAPTAQHLEQLRGWRVKPPRTACFSQLLPKLQRQLTRTQKQVGAFADAWDTCVPAGLRDRCRVETMRGGTVRVTASSSAIVFQLDRALRSGLLRELRAACSTTITRVDVKVGHVPRATTSND